MTKDSEVTQTHAYRYLCIHTPVHRTIYVEIYTVTEQAERSK